MARPPRGQPELAVQIATDLAQRHALVAGPTGLARRPCDAEPFPTDLDALWALRVDRAILPLLPEERLALALAADAGEVVDGESWEAACRSAGIRSTGRVRDHLVGARLAVPVPGGWRFARPAARAAAIATLGRPLRHTAP